MLYKKLLVMSTVVFFVLLIGFYIFQKPSDYTTGNTLAIDGSSSVENAPLWEHDGKIAHIVTDTGDFWGLGIGFWDKSFGSRKLRIDFLPEEFQIEGLEVKVKYGKSDVVGTDDWDTIIDIIEIEKV